ncbi:uncharacterized protein LOC127842939 isoform X2 [Dreissena polymorpha]|uniref:uncharacterized protein LOC127842939 isoform X2 n=1 Tax=Dreissena polymorpha TaxID=45954 RepID=UPI002264BE35|nr:uncharacterized protein LOC127842939 isoform X2 [Dreissena polymorpha]
MNSKPNAQTTSSENPLESTRGNKDNDVDQPNGPAVKSNATHSGKPRNGQRKKDDMKEKQATNNPSSIPNALEKQNEAANKDKLDQSKAPGHAQMKSAERNSLPQKERTVAKRPGNGSRQQQNVSSVPGANYADDYSNKQPRYDAHNHSERPVESHFNQDQKTQAMMQMQRAAEASKQMLYGVYGNFISILEEYEARTHEAKAVRSKIPIPDQSKKNLDDVQSIVETQLLLFETQQRACPKAISQSVNKELRQKTLHWAAVREEQNMREPVSEETIRENMQYIFKGKHEAMEIDQEFKTDDKKKATSPETRRSELDDAYTRGAKRMEQAMPELVAVLVEDLKEFEGDGIVDTK